MDGHRMQTALLATMAWLALDGAPATSATVLLVNATADVNAREAD